MEAKITTNIKPTFKVFVRIIFEDRVYLFFSFRLWHLTFLLFHDLFTFSVLNLKVNVQNVETLKNCVSKDLQSSHCPIQPLDPIS